MDEAEDRIEGTTALNRDEQEKLRNLFSIHDVEYLPPADICTYLGKNKTEKKNLVKLMVKYLPLMEIRKKRKIMIIDCRQFHQNPHFIVDLFRIDGNESKDDSVDFVQVFCDEKNVNRKPGSGRKNSLIIKMI